MAICKTILEAITHALESEELRLKPRSVRELWPWTVRGYPKEAWISYLLVREFSCRCPDQELEMEANVGGVPLVDLSICGLASVELKGPHRVEKNFNRDIYREILKDFKKQHDRARNDPCLEHFVLLILHASKKDFYCGCFKRWLDQLESDVRENNPGICIRLQPSRPLVLNGDEPWLMEFCLYSVR